jgi:hypothetical protein
VTSFLRPKLEGIDALEDPQALALQQGPCERVDLVGERGDLLRIEAAAGPGRLELPLLGDMFVKQQGEPRRLAGVMPTASLQGRIGLGRRTLEQASTQGMTIDGRSIVAAAGTIDPIDVEHRVEIVSPHYARSIVLDEDGRSQT